MEILDLERRDDGLYSCAAESDGGRTVGWGHITVEFPPTFEEQAVDNFWSWEQEKVNITCIATSIPNATSKVSTVLVILVAFIGKKIKSSPVLC